MFCAVTWSIFHVGWKVRWVLKSKFCGLSNGYEKFLCMCSRTRENNKNKAGPVIWYTLYAGDTMLSTHIWNLKKDNINYNMEWSINRQDQPYSHVTGVCRLCLGEKHEILFNPGQSTLNQRSEFYSHCRHKEMDLLSKVKTWFFLS